MSAPPPRCPRCREALRRGEALKNTAVIHIDFLGSADDYGCTISDDGPAVVVPVWKCKRCGYSRTRGRA